MFELSFYQYFTGLSKEDWLYRNQKKDLNILFDSYTPLVGTTIPTQTLLDTFCKRLKLEKDSLAINNVVTNYFEPNFKRNRYHFYQHFDEINWDNIN